MGGEQKKEGASWGRKHSFGWKYNSRSVWPPWWMLHCWLRHMPRQHESLLSAACTHSKQINVRLKHQIPYRTKNCAEHNRPTMDNEKKYSSSWGSEDCLQTLGCGRWPNGKICPSEVSLAIQSSREPRETRTNRPFTLTSLWGISKKQRNVASQNNVSLLFELMTAQCYLFRPNQSI